MQVISGQAKAVDVVRDVNLKVIAPLKLSAETSEGMRELRHGALFVGINNDIIANTATETNFAPTFVGSKVFDADSFKVGDVIRVTARGIISTT